MTLNKLASMIAKREGKKRKIKIADLDDVGVLSVAAIFHKIDQGGK